MASTFMALADLIKPAALRENCNQKLLLSITIICVWISEMTTVEIT